MSRTERDTETETSKTIWWKGRGDEGVCECERGGRGGGWVEGGGSRGRVGG